MSADDSLILVPIEELPTLRDTFLVEWPKYMSGWNTLDSQYRNITKIKDFPVKVCLPFGNKDYGVVVIWEMITRAIEISLYCAHEDYKKIKEAILLTKKINWSYRIIFRCVNERLIECARDILQEKMLKISVTSTNLFHVSRTAAKEFQIKIPSDVKIEMAEAKHVTEINLAWANKYPGSEDYFKKMIGWGLVTVIIGKERELRGWLLTSTRGEEHSLYIKEEYRRRGYGELLIKWVGKQLANQNREVLAYVVQNNEASEALFEKNQFTKLCKASTMTGICDQ